MNVRKKVCVVTAARSEYGLLRWVIDEIKNDIMLDLQLIVTGSHLSEEFGFTYKEIEKDGYHINFKVDMFLSTISKSDIAKSMGQCMIGVSNALNALKSDILVVLGDRYELLPICSAALIMGIPIAHISGGDITKGAIDDQIRNAVTMLSQLHFPGVESSAINIMRMINSNENVHVVGEPGLENFDRMSLMNREEIAKDLNLDTTQRWVLVTQHPETKASDAMNLDMITNIVKALDKFHDLQVVITKSNADFGGTLINDFFEKVADNNPDKYKLHSSLGQLKYLSLMKEAYFILGNSSSGIVEAPYLAKPVINLGERQRGRYLSTNIISVSGLENSIEQALSTIRSKLFRLSLVPDFYYGNGKTAMQIKDHLKEYLIKS